MGRDRGKGKAGGRGGGGGKMFIANEDELALRDEVHREAREARKARREEDEDEEGGGEGAGAGEGGGAAGEDSVFSFDRSEKPAAGGGGGIKLKELKEALPSAAASGVANPDPESAGMNRKEREALEAQKRKEEYQRRHMAGETPEAKKELARLAEVRARREAAAAERAKVGRAPGWTKNGVDDEASSSSSDEESSDDETDPEAARAKASVKAVLAAQEAQKAAVAEKKKAAAAAPAEAPATKAAAGGGGGEAPKLKAMDIKKMNGDALKDALRERKLDIQGAKKDLLQRLLDFEAAR